MAVYKEDFENERRDKERALSEKESLSKQTTSLLNEIKLLKERVCIALELLALWTRTLVELFKSYCLPHITYACEALPFSKTDILRLDITSLYELYVEYLMYVAEKTLTACGVILTFLS